MAWKMCAAVVESVAVVTDDGAQHAARAEVHTADQPYTVVLYSANGDCHGGAGS